MRAVRQIATPPSSLCKEPTALLHNIEKKNSQPKRNPAPTPGSIPLRSAPPHRNCKRSAGSIPLDPLNRQHSFCLGAPPLPSCSPTDAVAPLHARSPSRVCVWGGGRQPQPGTAPTQAGTAAAPKRKAGRLDVVHSPARLESIFGQSLSPERATALLVPHGGPSNPISPAPTTDFAPSRPTRASRAPAREQTSNPKNMSRKNRKKPKTPGPSSLRLGFRTPSRIPPPARRSGLFWIEKKRGGKKSRQAALISKNTVKSRRNFFPRFRVAPA